VSKKIAGTFRQKKVNFSQVSNTALHDDNLSLKAKGLYSLIQSMITLPNEEGLKIWKIRTKCKEGDDAFDSAWKELKKYGYLKQYRIPDSENRGHFRYEYDLLDNPDLLTPSVSNLNADGEVSTSGQPEAVSLPLKTADTEHPQKQFPAGADHTPENRGDGHDHIPGFPPYGKPTGCLNHQVENRGDNNNTLFSNTLLGNTQSVSQSTGNTVKAEGQTDGQTDEIRDRLKKQIDYDYFEDNFPEDLSGVDVLIDCMVEMLVSPSTKINGYMQQKSILKSYIGKADSETVREFLGHMRGTKMRDIKNVRAYWKSAFINFLEEQALAVATI